jgi:nucleoside-diphosphate-sugar epimerase
MHNRIVVTGSSGLIGHALCEQLLDRGADVRRLLRQEILCDDSISPEGFSIKVDWENIFSEVATVIHCAARVHLMSDRVDNPLAEYRRINVELTLNLARHAAKAGVRRFIFLSSIKVNGEHTILEKPFTADDIPNPQDFYAISKHEAELGLRLISRETGIEIVIIRAPLVYGPEVKANFLSMVRWLALSMPLPFGAINNRRSLIGIDNLIDLIITCIDHPGAANQIFLASDGQDLSTTDILKHMASALNRPARLISVPVPLLYFFATLIGRRPAIERLCSSLQVDISKTSNILGWRPKITLDEGFTRVAGWYERR